MNKLPNELLSKIFYECSTDTRCILQTIPKVCKRWKEVCKILPPVKVDLSQLNGELNRKVFLYRHINNINSVSYFKASRYFDLDADMWQIFQERFKNLKVLDLSELCKHKYCIFSNVMNVCKNIQKVILSKYIYMSYSYLAGTNIKELVVPATLNDIGSFYDSAHYFYTGSKYLTHLTIPNLEYVDKEACNIISKNFPSLRELNMLGCDECLDQVQIKRLGNLKVYKFTADTQDRFDVLLECGLEEIEIDNFMWNGSLFKYSETKDHIHTFPLKKLTISGSDITNYFVAYLYYLAPDLEYIELDNCYMVTDYIFTHLYKLKKLETVKIIECDRIKFINTYPPKEELRWKVLCLNYIHPVCYNQNDLYSIFEKLGNLEEINLSGSPNFEYFYHHIPRSEKALKIYADGLNLTDCAIRIICQKFPYLSYISNKFNTLVSDKGITDLAGLSGLRCMYMDDAIVKEDSTIGLLKNKNFDVWKFTVQSETNPSSWMI